MLKTINRSAGLAYVICGLVGTMALAFTPRVAQANPVPHCYVCACDGGVCVCAEIACPPK